MAGPPRAGSGGAVYDHTAPRGGGGFPGHPPLRPGRLFVHTAAGSDGGPEHKRQKTDNPEPEPEPYFDDLLDFDFSAGAGAGAGSAAAAAPAAPDPAERLKPHPELYETTLEDIKEQLPRMITNKKKGNIFSGKKGNALKAKLLDELYQVFEHFVSDQRYLEDMTLARLRGTMEWDLTSIQPNPVYYRAFEKESNISSVNSLGQYANPAIQTVYAFAITAMLISKNSTPLERHAKYVARTGVAPYQNMRNYAESSPSNLLKRAILATFSVNQTILGNWEENVNTELRDTTVPAYLITGEISIPI